NFSDLPQKARDYIKFIENSLGVPIDIISTGPSREQNIYINKLFKNE
ncbi:MAG: adenylosuccinate synthetase, partial [Pseudomonadota bacterium]|nr:adenylosuccinate synthetase [Pseudomonadota bacterium]